MSTPAPIGRAIGLVRIAVVISGFGITMIGYGAVVPYLYADIVTARDLGRSVAAVMCVLFALGALLATPLAGRLADTVSPVTVIVSCHTLAAAAVALLALAPSPVLIWVAALAYGAADATAQPSVSVILLQWTPPERQRDGFGWQFIAMNVGMALGGFIGGQVVDLATHRGVLPVYAIATVSELVGAVTAFAAAAGHVHIGGFGENTEARSSAGRILRAPVMRRAITATVLLTLACYAQYESGLPAYALTVLHVSPKILGAALAANALCVAAFTGPLVRLTRNRQAPHLLAACAATWVVVWMLLAVPLLGIGHAALLLVVALLLLGLGETVLSPVLYPFVASLAPPSTRGRAIATVTAAQTAATMAGPALSGALLAANLPTVFIGAQLLFCLGALAMFGRFPATRHATSSGTGGADDRGSVQ